jgi:hypothetical protein
VRTAVDGPGIVVALQASLHGSLRALDNGESARVYSVKYLRCTPPTLITQPMWKLRAHDRTLQPTLAPAAASAAGCSGDQANRASATERAGKGRAAQHGQSDRNHRYHHHHHQHQRGKNRHYLAACTLHTSATGTACGPWLLLLLLLLLLHYLYASNALMNDPASKYT